MPQLIIVDLMFPRVALVIFGILVMTIATIIWSGCPFQYFRAQMATGRAYMDSMTEEDFRVWTDRTKKLLSEYEPGSGGIGAYGLKSKTIPPDLRELQIIRIDTGKDHVCYVWMGGLDHTELQVRRMKGGDFQFIAHYDDSKSRVIWPKE